MTTTVNNENLAPNVNAEMANEEPLLNKELTPATYDGSTFQKETATAYASFFLCAPKGGGFSGDMRIWVICPNEKSTFELYWPSPEALEAGKTPGVRRISKDDAKASWKRFRDQGWQPWYAPRNRSNPAASSVEAAAMRQREKEQFEEALKAEAAANEAHHAAQRASK